MIVCSKASGGNEWESRKKRGVTKYNNCALLSLSLFTQCEGEEGKQNEVKKSCTIYLFGNDCKSKENQYFFYYRTLKAKYKKWKTNMRKELR